MPYLSAATSVINALLLHRSHTPQDIVMIVPFKWLNTPELARLIRRVQHRRHISDSYQWMSEELSYWVCIYGCSYRAFQGNRQHYHSIIIDRQCRWKYTIYHVTWSHDSTQWKMPKAVLDLAFALFPVPSRHNVKKNIDLCTIVYLDSYHALRQPPWQEGK